MSILESSPFSTSDNPFRIYGSASSARSPSPSRAYRTPSSQPLLHVPPISKRAILHKQGLVATLITAFVFAIALLPHSVWRQALPFSVRTPQKIPLAETPVTPRLETTNPSGSSARATRPAFASLRRVQVTSPFGWRWGRQHQGIDFAARSGAPIYAADAGKVVYSGWTGGYGRTVLLEHRPGFRTRYAHCEKLLAHTGQMVSKGALIARVGSTGHSTGPHLHFEVIVNGRHRNPARYYRVRPGLVRSEKPVVKSPQEALMQSVADLMKLWNHS